MKTMKILSALTLSLVAGVASAQNFGGSMMAQGTFASGYQPAMQPGAYRAQPSQGPGEQVSYSQQTSQPCTPRGNVSAIEGPIANGQL
ncbi:MAG: hypothetical protein ABIR96_11675, partial [Bdellovibrionota bacterium]